jgi:ribosomal protein L12E/L44/L45/RPP1/RPP2
LIEHLSSKHKALNFIPSSSRKRKEGRKKERKKERKRNERKEKKERKEIEREPGLVDEFDKKTNSYKELILEPVPGLGS